MQDITKKQKNNFQEKTCSILIIHYLIQKTLLESKFNHLQLKIKNPGTCAAPYN